jgi:hypothetical protein
MKEIQDTLQVTVANSSAIALSITNCNEVLTFVSLILAIGFTVYKFLKYEEKKLK